MEAGTHAYQGLLPGTLKCPRDGPWLFAHWKDIFRVEDYRRKEPELPLPGWHLHCSFHLLLILQQTSLIIYHIPANLERGTTSSRISVTFRNRLVSRGLGRGACYFIWYLRSFLGRLAPPSFIRAGVPLAFLSPPDVWVVSLGLCLGTISTRVAGSGKCEHPFPEQPPRPPFSTANKHLMKSRGASAVWEAELVPFLPFLMFWGLYISVTSCSSPGISDVRVSFWISGSSEIHSYWTWS